MSDLTAQIMDNHPDVTEVADESGGHFYNPNNNKKRRRNPKACGRCSHKKIRCDATSDSGKEKCSNCKDADAECQFADSIPRGLDT
jgi:hypothetical protein